MAVKWSSSIVPNPHSFGQLSARASEKRSCLEAERRTIDAKLAQVGSCAVGLANPITRVRLALIELIKRGIDFHQNSSPCCFLLHRFTFTPYCVYSMISVCVIVAVVVAGRLTRENSKRKTPPLALVRTFQPDEVTAPTEEKARSSQGNFHLLSAGCLSAKLAVILSSVCVDV